MKNAQDEDYELVELDEFTALFTNARLNRESIPKGLFCYDIRHDDECQGVACEVSPFIGVNHWGTILSKKEIPLDSTGSYYPKEMEGHVRFQHRCKEKGWKQSGG